LLCCGELREAGENCRNRNMQRLSRFIFAYGKQLFYGTNELRSHLIRKEFHEIGGHRRCSLC
jgi:hypothetical protein